MLWKDWKNNCFISGVLLIFTRFTYSSLVTCPIPLLSTTLEPQIQANPLIHFIISVWANHLTPCARGSSKSTSKYAFVNYVSCHFVILLLSLCVWWLLIMWWHCRCVERKINKENNKHFAQQEKRFSKSKKRRFQSELMLSLTYR